MRTIAQRISEWRWRVAGRAQALRDDAGSALIELALMLSLVGVPLMLGTVYLATIFRASIEIANAAHAGALYGMRSSTYAEDTSYIISAAQAEASDFGTALSVTPTVFYACSNAEGGTQYATPALANAACTGSVHSLEFIQVVASATVTPLGSIAGMPGSITLSNTSVMEVQE
jgi:Flp pilus assembly protein TadG